MDKFIKEVRNHPIVYDVKRMDYRDARKKSSTWELIKDIVGMDDVEQCQKTWKSLRDRYVKELKQIELKKKNDPTHSPKSGWEYFDLMEFYKSCGRPKKNDPYIGFKRKLDASDSSPPEAKERNPAQNPISDSSVTSLVDSSALSKNRSNIVCVSESSASSHDGKNIKSEGSNDEKVLYGHGRKVDEAEHFSLSVAETLRRLPRQKMALAKTAISDILYKIEFDNYVPKSEVQL